MNFIKRLLNRSSVAIEDRVFQVPVGEQQIEVSGDQYRKNNLKNIYKQTSGELFPVAVTRPIRYQIEQGWPNMPFVNVNTEGSRSTTKDNWLGYVRYEHGCLVDFETLLEENTDVECMARIKKRGSDYDLVMMVAALPPVSVSHERDHVKYVTALKKKFGDYADITLVEQDCMSRKKPAKRYAAMYGKYPLGYISVTKSKEIKEYIQDKEYSAKIDLRYHDETSRYAKISIYAH